ncbi:hypothetical protein ACOSQ4_006084 [Xanthoceras sorbifolium]
MIVLKNTSSCDGVTIFCLAAINIQFSPVGGKGPSNELKDHTKSLEGGAVSMSPVYLILQDMPSWVVWGREIPFKDTLVTPLPDKPDD